MKHALLSASASHRWISCPPSAKLSEGYEDTSSDYAQQGTEAHSLCEYKLKKALGMKVRNPKSSLKFYDEEMENCAEGYASFVMEKYQAAKNLCSDTIVLIEQRLDFSRFVPEGFGTGDCVIVSDGTLTIIDYKHGQGVIIDAEMNPQMMCYALGAINAFDGIYDIENIVMTIFQPKRENISTYSMSKNELTAWAEKVLKPAAELAIKGEGEFKAGEHCRFCKVKATCRKRAEYNLELAKYDFEMPPTLDDDEVEIVLAKADELIAWCSDIKEYALQQAVNGKKWKEWKLVEGRSNRKYVNEDVVADIVQKAGYEPFEKKLLGITAMTKLLGKAKFDELLGEQIEKPQGKPTLVSITDKRPPMNTAADDFKEEK